VIPFLHRLAPESMEENPLWLVVLCDMMTNLMLFFLVMFVFTRQDPKAQQELIKTFAVQGVIERPEDRKPDSIFEYVAPPDIGTTINGAFAKAGLFHTVSLEQDEQSVRLRLLERVLFRTAEASLSPSADSAIALLAKILKEMPNEVVIEGHTDDLPIRSGRYRTNWELSVARSYSVIERLVREGVPPERLVAAGYGEFHPVASNAAAPDAMDRQGPRKMMSSLRAAEIRAENRRVEIVILRRQEDQ